MQRRRLTPPPVPALHYFEQQDGAYHGQVDRAFKKHGVGIFISDTSMAYVGDWHSDQVDGAGLLIFPFGGYLLGEFQKSQIQGPAILRMPNSKIIVGHFFKSALHGICFTFMLQQKVWLTAEYVKGVLLHQLSEEKGDSNTVPKSMTHYPQLQIIFQRVINKDFHTKSALIASTTIENGYLYLGVESEGLGVIFHPNPFTFDLKMGYFKNKNLDGLGRHIKDIGDIFDGMWLASTLTKGFKFNKQKGSYTEYHNSKESEHDAHFKYTCIPHDQMQKYRSQQHPLSKVYFHTQSKTLFGHERYIQLSLEDFQSAVFVQKSQRSSILLSKPVIEMLTTITKSHVESSLSLIRRHNYLQVESPPSQQLELSFSPIKEEQLSPIKQSANISLQKPQQDMVIKPDTITEQPHIPEQISTLRKALAQQTAPLELKMKIFEPFKIVNFEQLRNNSLQNTNLELSQRRSKKKIFQEVESSPKQFRATVREYKQFLDVSGLSRQHDISDYNE